MYSESNLLFLRDEPTQPAAFRRGPRGRVGALAWAGPEPAVPSPDPPPREPAAPHPHTELAQTEPGAWDLADLSAQHPVSGRLSGVAHHLPDRLTGTAFSLP